MISLLSDEINGMSDKCAVMLTYTFRSLRTERLEPILHESNRLRNTLLQRGIFETPCTVCSGLIISQAVSDEPARANKAELFPIWSPASLKCNEELSTIWSPASSQSAHTICRASQKRIISPKRAHRRALQKNSGLFDNTHDSLCIICADHTPQVMRHVWSRCVQFPTSSRFLCEQSGCVDFPTHYFEVSKYVSSRGVCYAIIEGTRYVWSRTIPDQTQITYNICEITRSTRMHHIAWFSKILDQRRRLPIDWSHRKP